jgi:RsiW-degrading membrane proteinase PrsW (M82 family)
MLEQVIAFFTSFFADPSVWGIGLAIYFGAIWLIPYYPPLFKDACLWAVMVVSAFLALAATAFVQIPLQFLAGQAIGSTWSQEYVMSRILLFGIPQILLSGLVQEGAKMVPLVWYWRREGKNLDPKLGLAVGAAAGAAFGIFEAQWVHNTIFASVNIWEVLRLSGPLALTGFWERFFVVAAHTAFSALAGYGLALGKGWQFYLIASGLHALLNYSAVLLTAGVLSTVQLEIYVAVFSLSVTAWALWLRWRTGSPVPRKLAPPEFET